MGRGRGRVLVTGASGFVGRALVRHLLEDGRGVVAMDVKEPVAPEEALGDRFIPMAASFDDYPSISDSLEKCGARSVIHLAWAAPYGDGFSDARLQMKNICAALDLIESCARANVGKFVFVSTANQFEVTRLVLEEAPSLRPTSVYGTCKLMADLLLKQKAQELGIEYCSGSLAMVYGPGDRSNKLPNVVASQLVAGESPRLIEGNGDYDLVYIDDVVEALTRILDSGVSSKTYYVGHRDLETFRWWMERMGEAVAPDVGLRFGEFPDLGGIDYQYVDLEALHRDTGFECTADVSESFRATADWIREADPLGML